MVWYWLMRRRPVFLVLPKLSNVLSGWLNKEVLSIFHFLIKFSSAMSNYNPSIFFLANIFHFTVLDEIRTCSNIHLLSTCFRIGRAGWTEAGWYVLHTNLNEFWTVYMFNVGIWIWEVLALQIEQILLQKKSSARVWRGCCQSGRGFEKNCKKSERKYHESRLYFFIPHSLYNSWCN